MAFIASHHAQHDVSTRVAESTVCHDEPIWVGFGDTNAYLSCEEATQLHMQLGEVLAKLKAQDAQQVAA